MRLKGLLPLLLLLFAIGSLKAQQYNYRHYTTADGLPSSTVYSMVQDDLGYLWFSTSQGVARFDGYKFKTFTVLDGLPDNDVLAIFKGQRGKLWFICFSKQLSYYEESTKEIKIYDKYNLPSLPLNVLEQRDGTVMIGTHNSGLCIIKDDQTNVLTNAQLPLNSNFALPDSANGDVWVAGLSRFFNLSDRSIMFQIADSTIRLDDFIKICRHKERLLVYTKRHILELKDGCLTFVFSTPDYGEGIFIHFVDADKAGNLLVATQLGAFVVPASPKQKNERLLPFEPISRFMEDAEGNYWMSSLNDGIYMLPASSRLVENIASNKGLSNNKISSLFKLGGDVLFSTNNGTIGGWINDSLVSEALSRFFFTGLANCQKVNDTLTLCASNFGTFIFSDLYEPNLEQIMTVVAGHDIIIKEKSLSLPVKPYNLSFGNMKHVTSDGKNRIWLAGLLGLLALEIDLEEDVFHFRSIQPNRTTAVKYAHDGRLWFSTLDSMGTILPDGRIEMTQLDSFGIKGYVTAIVEDDNHNLWFTSSGYGLYVFDRDSLYNYSTTHGLSSSFITSAALYNDQLILGTNNGVNIVHVTTIAPYADRVYPLSVNDALVSKEVNHLLIDKGKLFVATSKGISQVPISAFTTDTLSPRVYIRRFQINERDTSLLATYTLPYSMNNIKLEYLGLLYKADGNLMYRYQMQGIDTGWVETPFTNAQYPTLPPGSYTFKVDARSLQGPWSNAPATIQITISPPFWQTWWFRLLMVVVVAGIVIGISYAIIKYYRNQSQVAQRMVELEGQALRANMNPHFVFNALNAIHDFIANQDERSAHLYLGKFAQLVRSILDQSRKNYISLDEEIDTLRLYLELENMRFEHKFEYQIKIADDIQPYEIELPPMLIQPYLENAIRHGLMDMSVAGMIEVAFAFEAQYLKCCVTDNGIGRKKAAEISSKRLKSHRSVGMEITKKRIELLIDGSKHGQVVITDLYDINGQATGTKVELVLPLKVQ